MTTAELRAVMIGLIGFAATQEQTLLVTSPDPETGEPSRWAAAPLVAHNTEFKRQQVQRLRAIIAGQEPPEFGEFDHASAQLYGGYAAQAPSQVAQESYRVSGELIDAVRSVRTDDLLDPARNPWLRGRQLWLQVVVRGFWHPTGHLVDYYLGHAQPDRAVAVAAHGVTSAAEFGAPDPARGMAAYNLACAQSRSGLLDEARQTLAEAVRLNPDVRANASRDPDLAPLRAADALPSNNGR
jgi:hypothetical protein